LWLKIFTFSFFLHSASVHRIALFPSSSPFVSQLVIGTLLITVIIIIIAIIIID